MFYMMTIGGIIGVILCFMGWAVASKTFVKALAVFGMLLFAGIFATGWFTAQGQMAVTRLTASSSNGNWLVIDNSGGKTLRHWVIEEGYVESSTQSDGWQFRDEKSNLCYVSGDAFVTRISEPIDEFVLTYKKRFNIPIEQKALK